MLQRSIISVSVALALAVTVAPARAQSETRSGAVFSAPNVEKGTVAKDIPFMGQTFTNQGLVAVGRVPATTLDGLGQSLGSMSDMVIDLSKWRRNGNTYTGGVLIALPDRGYNAGDVYSDYAARLQRYAITLTPSYSGPAPADTLKLDFIGTQMLKDNTGANFTGLDPATGVKDVLGAKVPSPSTGIAAGKIALDAEGLAIRNDGSFYISDEYAAGIYYFDKTGTLVGIIQAPPALMPMTKGALNFNSLKSPDMGRNANQGLEGLALTPDNKKLATLLQSSAIQDGGDKKPVTRLMIYDISSNPTPKLPSEHYALVLPTINGKTAAQSALFALNSKQFLVLARDGTGLGNGSGVNDGGAYGYKSILLIDTSGATNLAGTQYESSYAPIAPGGKLLPSVTPVWQSELVNLLNADQLGRFGLNLNANKQQNEKSMSGKWEALGIAPVLDPSKPNDWFLFTGNDNDFQSTNCSMPLTPSGAVQSGNCASTFNNDTRVLVHQLTLPTYVSPVYLQAMQVGGAAHLSQLRATDAQALLGFHDTVNNFLAGEWLRPGLGFKDGVRVFADGSVRRVEDGGRGFYAGTVGAEFPLGEGLRAGLNLTAGSGKSRYALGEYDARPTGVSAHLRFAGQGWTAKLHGSQVRTRFTHILRRDVFDLTAEGQTRGRANSLGAEVGLTRWMGPNMGWMPFVGLEAVSSHIDAYAETGAAGGDIRYGEANEKAHRAIFGLHWAAGLGEGTHWHPVVRASYAAISRAGNKPVSLSLAHVQHADATQPVLVDAAFRPAFNLQGQLVYDLTAKSNLALGAMVTRAKATPSSWGANLRYTLGF